MGELDLAAIQSRLLSLQRHAGTTDYAGKVIADCAALLAEVERLRAIVQAVEQQQGAKVDNARF